MSPPAQRSVQIRRTLSASADEVFAAWTQPSLMRRWLHMAESWRTPYAEVDLRPGGAFRVDMQTGNGRTLTYRGTYQEVDPPRRLVFTWPPLAQSNLNSLVTVELSDGEGGGTVLQLTQDRLLDREMAQVNKEGWAAVLDMLELRGLRAD